jgi:hypothetical protein
MSVVGFMKSRHRKKRSKPLALPLLLRSIRRGPELNDFHRKERSMRNGLFICGALSAFFLGAMPIQMAAAKTANRTLTAKELEKLAEPIALYPDVLLQHVLAAATFPEQIVDAAIYLEQDKDPKQIAKQPWDTSVKAIADYPSVLAMMATDIDWTIGLGDAFINQSKELRRAVQKLRARAKSVGNLKNSPQQNVVVEQAPNGDQVIVIQPTEPEVIYVPTTTTTVVYEQPVQQASNLQPLATFGLGMALGYAMGDDDDDHYYYGGYGPSYWYREDVANHYIDYREDRWNDVYDYYDDRQEFRQDQFEDWTDQRGERYEELKNRQGEYLNEVKNRAGEMGPEQRAQARTRAQQGKQQWQAKSPEARRQELNNRAASSGINRSAAQERLNAARSSGSLQSKAQTVKSNPQFSSWAQSAKSYAGSRTGSSSRTSALAMSGGARSANYASARGTSSLQRSYGGSRSFGGSYGGGSRSFGGGGRAGGGGRRR